MIRAHGASWLAVWGTWLGILVAAGIASATALPDGSVVWDFEGTALTFPNGNTTSHSVVGSLQFSTGASPLNVQVQALVGGVDTVSGGLFYVTAVDGAPGTVDQITFQTGGGTLGTLSSPYSLPPQGSPAPIDPPTISLNLSDKNGSLFDGAAFPLPPAHAPNIDTFSIATLSISQNVCIVSNPISGTLLCNMQREFELTFTSFSDPVPEPGWLAWVGMLGLLGLRRASRQGPARSTTRKTG
ncbi:MAG TPA: hypothetical protein VMR50_06730 [Myxococcota bacterium]|nr:hypothetical protein [Myxococcota bacterium]